MHSLVDDHPRLAYSELHRDEKAATVTGFVQRGLAFFAAHGITAKRLISDNAWTYTRNRSLAELLTQHNIRHLTIPYRRPQVNGKVERYQQTLKREWALGLSCFMNVAGFRARIAWGSGGFERLRGGRRGGVFLSGSGGVGWC